MQKIEMSDVAGIGLTGPDTVQEWLELWLSKDEHGNQESVPSVALLREEEPVAEEYKMQLCLRSLLSHLVFKDYDAERMREILDDSSDWSDYLDDCRSFLRHDSETGRFALEPAVCNLLGTIAAQWLAHGVSAHLRHEDNADGLIVFKPSEELLAKTNPREDAA